MHIVLAIEGILSPSLVDVTTLKVARKPVKLQKEGKEASEVTEGKSSRMRWGR